MKPVLMRHVEAVSESFKAWKNASPYVHNPFHYHPEIEITCIVKGKGSFILGDQVIPYSDGELILIGPNIPHEFRSEAIEIPDYFTQSISVHFVKNFLGLGLFEIPEAVFIKQLLEQSERCIRVTDISVKEIIQQGLLKLTESKGIERVSWLLQILNTVSTTAQIEILSDDGLMDTTGEGQNSRINLVFRYVIDNFKSQISITEAAKLVNFTNTSFCRFFKQRTHKSFVQYVNEIRIAHACKLLVEGNYSINRIASESGFDNISNFNTQFKKIKLITPSQFIETVKK
jgi:AraC-like DNA-binding protein